MQILFIKVLFLVSLSVTIYLISFPSHASEGLWQENGIPVCLTTTPQSYPQLTSDGNNGAIIVWQDNRGGNYDIYAQRVNNAGELQWATDGIAICEVANNQTNPQIISDSNGGAMVVWEDQRSGSDDIYAQRVNGAGELQWPTGGVAICTAVNSQFYPNLISDGNGGAILIWWDNRSGNYDIYAQRVNSAGAVQWATDGIAVCAAANSQIRPQIISDSDGGAIMIWQDNRGGNYDIYAQRVNNAGELQWATDGIAICEVANNQTNPQIISDSNGGAMVVWEDQRDGSDDIYAQRVNGAGELQWPTGGVAICTAVNSQAAPQLISDEDDGAIIVWCDYRNGGYDIYTQRLNGTGIPQWTNNGIAICSNKAYSPQLVSDNNKGAMVAWQDQRNGHVDIYAQRLNGSGIPQWVANGMAICNSINGLDCPRLISDGNGGMIIVWMDGRNGSWNTYAQYMIRPRPQAAFINSPAISGSVFHATIGGHWFIDDRGSVMAARLTRTASADIPFSNGTLNILDANYLNCDFDLSSANPGEWFLILTDNLSQSSKDSVILTIITPTSTFTSTATFTISPTITSTPTFTLSPTISPTTTITLTSTESATATLSYTTTVSPTCSFTPTPTPTPTITFAPTLTSTQNPTATPSATPGPGRQTITIDHYTYIADPNGGLQIYDNSDPDHPQIVYSLSGNRRIYIKDHYLFMVDCQGDLCINDIQNPAQPLQIYQRATGGEAVGISGSDNIILVADGQEGVAIFQVLNIYDIAMLDRIHTPGNARDVGIMVDQRLAYAVWPDGNQWTFDISKYLAIQSFDNGGYATPNPFLPLLGQKVFFNFRFEDPNAAYAIRIYNLRGQLQRTLTATREWDGRSDAGHLCEGGVYVYQIEAEGKRVSGKVILLK